MPAPLSDKARRPVLSPPTNLPIWPDEPDLLGGAGGAGGASSSSGTAPTKPKPAAWRSKQRRIVVGKDGSRIWTVGELVVGALSAWSALLLAFLAWWRPHLGLTGGATGAGVAVGFLYSFLYYRNVKAKEQHNQVLCMDPGLKGCQYLLGTLPNWISLTEREKMEWCNRMLVEVWPYYDRGVCAVVKDCVEPLMDYYKPPILKKIFFEELTFGEAPVRIEGLHVRELDDAIDMEVDVRWCGDANIALAIDLPAGGEFSRLHSKVKDIVFVATLKIILKPLVDKIPGFAAIALALKAPPIIKYRLDFGVLPGGITTVVTAPIRKFVDFIINTVIVGMLQWPNRLTVPILGWNGWVFPGEDPVVDLEIERLGGRQRGVVRVHVIAAKELKAYDTLTGKSDPFVEVFTSSDHRSSTRVINNNLSPMWDELLYLPVLELDTVLRVEVFDYDAVNLANVKDLFGGKGSRELMGRTALPLAPFIADEGLEDELWMPLGKGDWTNLEGPGRGEGLIKLGLQYRAVENIAGDEILHATQGLLLVGVIRAFNLKPKGSNYVVVKLSGPKHKKGGVPLSVAAAGDDGAVAPSASGSSKLVPKASHKMYPVWNNPNPRWSSDNKFTLYDVEPQDMLTITVMETAAIGPDDETGSVTLPLSSVITSKQVSRWTGEEQAGYMFRDFVLETPSAGKLAGLGPKALTSKVSAGFNAINPMSSAPESAASSLRLPCLPRVQLELEFLPHWA